jgi:hypothetical protein
MDLLAESLCSGANQILSTVYNRAVGQRNLVLCLENMINSWLTNERRISYKHRKSRVELSYFAQQKLLAAAKQTGLSFSWFSSVPFSILQGSYHLLPYPFHFIIHNCPKIWCYMAHLVKTATLNNARITISFLGMTEEIIIIKDKPL